MMIRYLDPSTWIKRHFREAGSDAVNALFRVVIVDQLLIAQAERLTMIHHLRTMDAIHLAPALAVGPRAETIIVSADLEVAHRGRARRCLAVLNPSSRAARIVRSIVAYRPQRGPGGRN